MALVATKTKYHVALDGQGLILQDLILQGVPDRPAYLSNNAPVYGTRFASGDRDYNDLSQWWYLTQTDWTGGIKNTFSFADDAKYYYSSNIDVRTKPGVVRLEHDLELVYDNDASDNEILNVSVSIQGGNDRTHFQDNGGSFTLGGSAVWDSVSNPVHEIGRGAKIWAFGDSIQYDDGTTPYPFTRVNLTTAINGIIDGSIDNDGSFGLDVGGTLFILMKTTAEKISIIKTTSQAPTVGGDFTLCAEVPFGISLGAKMAGAAHLGGKIIYLVAGSPQWGLYEFDIATNVVTELAQFDGSTQIGIYYGGGRFVKRFKDHVLITVCKDGSDDEDGDIYKYDGSTLTKIWGDDETKKAFSTREAKPWVKGGAVVHGDFAYWGNLCWDGEAMHNFIKAISDDPDEVAIPVGSDGFYLYMVDNVVTGSDPQSQLYRYQHDGAIFKDGANNSAFLVFSQHDKLQSIDKLLNSVNIGFEQFATDQIIRVYYSTNPLPDPDLTTGGWTLLGTASHSLDGASAVSKTFNFPAGTTAKKVWFRVELQADGTNTPGLTAITLEYLPMPEYKKQWNINANIGDETKTLDGALPETTARELKSRLERAWWTKSQLDFQDVDYASTTITDNPLSDSATTINVATTNDFPEQGRLRIDDEEVFYTGKTPKSFTGVVRGARGTKAVSHTASTQIHNGYKVLVLGVESRIPVLLEGKHVEYTFGLSLREV